MVGIDIKTGLRHWPVALSHPTWALAWARGGRAGLFRQVVGDSLEEVQRGHLAYEIRDLARLKPRSAVGRMGGTQEYLFHAIRLLQPETVVETGVFRGISSAFILSALSINGHGRLFSIDLPEAIYQAPGRGTDFSRLPDKTETGFVVPRVLRSRWTLIRGDSRVELPALLSRLGQIDTFIHDIEHTYSTMEWEYMTAWPHLRSGGFLVSDDIDWNSAFDDFTGRHQIDTIVKIRDKLGFALKRA